MKVKKILIGITLLASWIVLTAIYVYSRSNVTVITDYLQNSALTKTTYSELLKGQKITGEFVSPENYLGQVLIRFYNFDRINKDSVIFRIKEKGNQSWIYENIYKTDQFVPNDLFTFGFPIIPDSKYKKYYFEIESVAGKAEDAVTVSSYSPQVGVIFQYPKAALIKNPKLGIEFLENKFKYLRLNTDLMIQVFIYLDYIFILLTLEYLFLMRASFKKIRLSSSAIIIVGLVALLVSSLLVYLKKLEPSATITLISYYILIVGVIYKILKNE